MKTTIMNYEQTRAIKSLEQAFKKCKKANLAFHGMDGCLLVWDATEEKALTCNGESICEQQYKINGNQGNKIETHNTYKDSGGW